MRERESEGDRLRKKCQWGKEMNRFRESNIKKVGGRMRGIDECRERDVQRPKRRRINILNDW